jgi:hypothetical protein
MRVKVCGFRLQISPRSVIADSQPIRENEITVGPMKKIKPNEIYENMKAFLKSRGIELTDGSYSQAAQKSCGILTDAINMSQEGLNRARTEVEHKLDQVKAAIHAKTAPKPPPVKPASTKRPEAAAGRARKRKTSQAKNASKQRKTS